MANKFKPGDKVLYGGKKYTILGNSVFVIGLKPTGYEILDVSDDFYNLIDSEGNRVDEAEEEKLTKIEEDD